MADIGIRDVAALAGVSVTTASNSLNRPDIVSRRAAKLVSEAARTLGYVPNHAARQLKVGRSLAIGMAISDLHLPFLADLSSGADDVAEEAGYSLLLGNSRNSSSREARYLELFERQRVDGVLLAPGAASVEGLPRFRNRNVPVVLVGAVDASGAIASVSLDERRDGITTAEHLLVGGARRLLAILDPAERSFRLDGIEAAAQASGARVEVRTASAESEHCGRDLGRLVASQSVGDRPDAIICPSDAIAIGIIDALADAGIRIPEEIAVTGHGDTAAAATARIPVTSLRRPSYDLGAAAMRTLLAGLGDSGAPRSLLIPSTLVGRESSRAAEATTHSGPQTIVRSR